MRTKRRDYKGIIFMLIMYIVIFTSMKLFAQAPEPLDRNQDINLIEYKEVAQVDSILIFETGKIGLIGKVYLIEDLRDELEKISKKRSRFKFNIIKYYSDGKVIQCKTRRKVNFNVNN
jgi:hypothetical protein